MSSAAVKPPRGAPGQYALPLETNVAKPAVFDAVATPRLEERPARASFLTAEEAAAHARTWGRLAIWKIYTADLGQRGRVRTPSPRSPAASRRRIAAMRDDARRPVMPPPLMATRFWEALERWMRHTSRGAVTLPTGRDFDPDEIKRVVLAIVTIRAGGLSA
jgi:hypothetical protein